MNPILKMLACVPAALFVTTGLAWLVVPSFAAPQLGMPLLDGVGLSTQVADLASFFLTMGICILIGVIRDERVWLYPTILLLCLVASGRVLAWLAHGAAFAGDMIAIEIVSVALLLLAVRLPGPKASP